MGEGLGRNPTAGRALDAIISNGRGGIEGVGDLGATDLALIVGSVAPHPGEAVRLQVEAGHDALELRKALRAIMEWSEE